MQELRMLKQKRFTINFRNILHGKIIFSLYRMNDWIKHVKMFQAQHGCSYKDALKGASASYRKGSGLMSKPSKSQQNQMYTQGGNLKKTSKAQLQRIIAALGDKAVGRLTGMGAVGNMLKRQAADTTAQLIDAGGDRASSEMATRGTGVNRLKKAKRWEGFSNATIRDAIDTAGKAANVYYDSTSPMSQLGFGLKKHRKIRGKALMAAGY